MFGKIVERTPLEITLNHGDGTGGDGDPIVGVVARHPYVDIGFRFLMRDILQIACAPESKRGWTRFVQAPPEPEELQRALEPYRSAFMLDHLDHPAMQVQPSPERLAEMAKPKPRKTRKAAEAAPDAEEDDEGGAMPIAALLPDAPTSNVLANSRDFFVKRDTVGTIGAGAVLPVLYAHMVLFPPSGGGYFGLPHGSDSLKFWIAGKTLWRSIAANVLSRDHTAMQAGAWPPPCDATVFPWLDPDLAGLSLKKGDEAARKTLHRLGDSSSAKRSAGQPSLHPAAIPMPRRYRLCPAAEGICDLTGVEGSTFSQYERWPNGLQYSPAGWWAPFAAPLDIREWNGSAWVPRKAKSKAGAEGEAASDDTPEAAGPAFLKARGPLRFDQWLELSLRNPPSPPAQPRTPKEKEWKGVRHPPVVGAFMANESALRGRGARADRISTLAEETDYRLEAIAAIPDGKALGGFSRGSLALWHVENEAAEVIATAVRDSLEAADRIAGALLVAAREAGKNMDKAPTLAGQLRDGLMATLDARLAGATQDMFEAFETAEERDAAGPAVGRLRADLVMAAGREALTLFDVTFPFATLDPVAIQIAGARKKLNEAVNAIVRKHLPPRTEAKQQQAGARAQ